MDFSDFIKFTLQLAETLGIDILAIRNQIGNMLTLNTNHKTTLVGAINEVDSKVLTLGGLRLESDQPNSTVLLKDGSGNTLSELDVAFLNNEGTTLNLNEVTGRIELINDMGEVLSSASLESFVQNMIRSASFKNVEKHILEFKTSDGVTAFSVSFKIENIEGLTTVLNALNSRKFSAGNGLTGGGDLTQDRTISLGTPSTLDAGTSNETTTGSHSHVIASYTTPDFDVDLNRFITGFINGNINSPTGGLITGFWNTARNNSNYGSGFFARAGRAWFRTRENNVMRPWVELATAESADFRVYGLGTNLMLNLNNGNVKPEWNGFSGPAATATNFPTNDAPIISLVKGNVSGYMQLTGSGDLFLKGWNGTSSSGWFKVWHDGNFNPSEYAKLADVYTKSEALGLFVGKTGNETISDTKTFTSSPIVPNGTSNGHAVNLGQMNTALSGKADVNHTHTISQVTGLQSALDGKSNVGHTHAISDVTGLQTALDNLDFRPYGLGVLTAPAVNNWDSNPATGFYRNTATGTGQPEGGGVNQLLAHFQVNGTGSNVQLNVRRLGTGIFRFRFDNGAWNTMYHSGNFNPSEYAKLSDVYTKDQIYSKNEALSLFVGKTGVETISDTKTFTNSPVIPNGTIDSHAVNLGQLKLYFGNIGTLTASMNLNDKRFNTDMGTHVCTQNVTATEANNYPVNKAGMLSVYYSLTTHVVQKYVTYDTSETYTRYYYNGTWRPWVKGLSSSDVESLVYRYSLIVNNTTFLPLRASNGSDLTASSNSRMYDISVNAISTGVDTGARFVLTHNGTTWEVHDIGVVPKTSANPWIFIDSDGVPKLRNGHANLYTNDLNVREYIVRNSVYNWSRLLGLDFAALQNTPTTLSGYGITDAAPLNHTHAWNDITGKPTEFPPAPHTHTIGQVTGLQTALDGKSNVGHTHAWNEITNKPTVFPPEAHTHTIGQVTGLQTALDGKAPLNHTHAWSQITDKPTEFPPTPHTHAWGDITGKPTTFSPSAHTHTIGQVTGLQTALDGKQMKLTPGENIQINNDEISAHFDGVTGIRSDLNGFILGNITLRSGNGINIVFNEAAKEFRINNTQPIVAQTRIGVYNDNYTAGDINLTSTGTGSIQKSGNTVTFNFPEVNPEYFTNEYNVASQGALVEVFAQNSIVKVPVSVTSFTLKPLPTDGATIKVYASGTNNTMVNFEYGSDGIILPNGTTISSFVIQTNNGFTLEYIKILNKFLLIKQPQIM